jgi:hypothetical protein
LSFLLLGSVAFASESATQLISIESLPTGVWRSQDNDPALPKELGIKNISAYSYESGLVVVKAVDEDANINVSGFGSVQGYGMESLTYGLESDEVKIKSVNSSHVTLLIDDLAITLYRHSKSALKLEDLLGTWKSDDTDIRLSIDEDFSFQMQVDDYGISRGRFVTDPSAGLLATGNWYGDRQISPVFSNDKNALGLVIDDNKVTQFKKISDQPEPHFLLDENGNPVSLDYVSIDTHISDIVAQTTLELKFTNPNANSSEVALELPLPPNGTVISYSLEINGEMIPSSAVPKALARQAFDEIEMRGIDPGLAEVTKNNQFRTEIFPIERGEQRRVSITYIEPMNALRSSASKYEFPIHKLGLINELDFNLTVNSASKPRVKGLPKRAKFKRTNNKDSSSYNLTLNTNSFTGKSAVTIKTKPGVNNNGLTKIVKESSDGNYYFAIWGNTSDKPKPIRNVKKVTLAWDVSLSMSEHHQDYLSLMRHYLDRLEGVDLKVFLFSNELEELSFESGKPEALLEDLEKVTYDGASDFSNVATVFLEPADYYLVFTDGLSTLGNFEKLENSTPAYSVSPKEVSVNHPFLNLLSSNGNHFSLNKKNSRKIARAIGTQIPIPKITQHTNNIESIHVTRPYGFDSRFYINGKITNKGDAKLGLLLNSDKQEHINLSVKKTRVEESIKYLWAQASLQPLLAFPNLYEKEITEIGLKMSLPTPYTSLIVLEEIDDYVRYGITPPEKLLSASDYTELREVFLEEQEEDSLSRREDLLSHWQNRLDWWANPPRAKQVTQSVYAESDDSLQEIIVTGAINNQSGAQSISIEPWSPDTPYIKAIDAVAKDKWYEVYLEQRRLFAQQPAFYMDVAKHFFKNGLPKLGIKILGNIIEITPENPALQRMVAYALIEHMQHQSALKILTEVDKAYPFQATSKRDLARTWQGIAEKSGQKKHYQFAIENYYRAALESNDDPDGLPVVALTEMNRLISSAVENGASINMIDQKFIGLQHYDIRATVSWSNNMTDVDLHVIEPSGDTVYYSNRNSDIGGLLPYDNTSGFGPEVYLLKDAVSGTYTVEAQYYSNDSVEAFGPVTLILDLYLNYGKENEEHKTSSVLLDDEKDHMKVGSFTF